MKSFLDTSVLIAAFNRSHTHHQPSFDLLRRCEKNDAWCGLVYAYHAPSDSGCFPMPIPPLIPNRECG